MPVPAFARRALAFLQPVWKLVQPFWRATNLWLDADGLREVPVIATSARHGEGIAELRAEIARRVSDKKSTRQRIEADLRAVAARLNEECGSGKPRSLASGRVQAMEQALADSAGVPTVVSAVERSTRLRAGRATGWPLAIQAD